MKNLLHRKKSIEKAEQAPAAHKLSLRDRLKSLTKKQKIVAAVIAVIVLALCIGAGVFFYLKKSTGSQGFGGFGGMGGGSALSTDGMIAASGVISVGVTEEEFSVENLTTTLEIEEVYVSSEEEIEEGTKILKLNEEDVTEAREELEQTLRTAELAYRSGAIEYEQNLITAVYDRDSALLAGEQAEEVYNETVASLDDAIEQAQEALDEANEEIAEYESYVNDGSYSTYFKVDEYQQIYDEDLAILENYMDEYDVGWDQVTGGGGGGGMGGGDAQAVSMLQSLYKILETDLQNLEQAQEDYEDAVNNASFNLQTLQLNLPSLEQALTEAQESYDTQLLQAKLTYETSLANAESAESDYETAVQKAESDYDTLRDTYEDAQENLELFETLVGDGYFYATGSGTILRMNVRSGGTLTSEGIILMYSNPEDMSVTVSVDQSYIASLNVGDTAVVVTSDYGNFEGSVTEINPISNSSSRASVTYSVTVQLTGDSTAVPANESVTVIFGVTLEQINAQMNNTNGADVSGGDATIGGGGEMPSGEMPSGEAPSGDGTDAGQPSGEMPSGEAPGGSGEMPSMPSGEMPSGGGAPQGEVNSNAQ